MKLLEEIYECPECGWHFPVWRRPGRIKERNHLKWLYCVPCNATRNFIKVGLVK